MTELLSSVPKDQFLFTSEFACEGHSDKLCDFIADAILDACLAEDPASKVAVEVCTKTDVVIVLGEITSTANVIFEQVVRDAVKDAGYISEEIGLDYRTINIVVAVEEQSPDIASAVHLQRAPEEAGAGDQGAVVGFACDETPSCMPLSYTLSRDLAKKLKKLRETLSWLRPDGKAQVTVQYRSEGQAWVPVRIHTLVLSAQHSADVKWEEVERQLRTEAVDSVIPAEYLDAETIVHINPSKRFVVGGPRADAGVSGRKIDHQYGGHCIGNAIHGKDASKVERSAAYGARCAAKSLVKGGHCRRCRVQVSYAMGLSSPVAFSVHSFGTATGATDHELAQKVLKTFDFSPHGLIRAYDLQKAQYRQMAVFGPFGDNDFDAPWERVKEI